MHTYRAAGIDDWREFLGVTSRRHDHQSKYPVKQVQPVHPIMKNVPENWVTPMDELYVIDKLWPNARAIATSVSERDGKTYPVAWINQFGKARVFGTTYGHSDATFADPAFLNYVSRGVLWAAGRLEEK
jgi:type 1 glutamine amidotransferase